MAGKRVAIKKIKDAVEDDSDGKRLLRELKVDTLKLCPRSCFAYASCDNAAFGRICLCGCAACVASHAESLQTVSHPLQNTSLHSSLCTRNTSG